MLEGKVAVVTGSAHGIGRATAESLAGLGAAVVLTDVDAEAVGFAAKDVGGDTAVLAADLTDPTAPQQLVELAMDRFGRIDIIVNNAGYTLDRPIHTMTDADFQSMIDIHALVPFRVLRAAAPHLREPAKKERERGEEVFRKVVNVTSVAGTMGNAGQVNYSSAKAAVVGLTKSLAKEWGQFKVNVNAVAFGFIDTRMTVAKTAESYVRIADREVHVGIPAGARDAIAAMIPLGRAGTAAEAAAGVTFLCSPWSDYVHGQVLNITGGLAVGMDD